MKMAKTKLILLGLTSTFCLAACSTTSTHLGVDNREAFDAANNKQNVSSVALKGAPERHPAMTAAAIERYLTDSVKEPVESGGFTSGGGGGN